MAGTAKRRILLAYRREEPALWLGHLDMMRLFERAFSRASWPLAWSEDAFNPRPAIVFALPVAVGIETLEDPLEVSLLDPHGTFALEEALSRLDRTLPFGVHLAWGREEEGESGKSLMARVTGARYLIEAPGIGPAFRQVFQAGQPVLVTRVHKKKKQEVDLASRLLSLDDEGPDHLIFTGGAGSRDHLRLDLLLQALVDLGGLSPEAAQGARLVRLAVFLDGQKA